MTAKWCGSSSHSADWVMWLIQVWCQSWTESTKGHGSQRHPHHWSGPLLKPRRVKKFYENLKAKNSGELLLFGNEMEHHRCICLVYHQVRSITRGGSLSIFSCMNLFCQDTLDDGLELGFPMTCNEGVQNLRRISTFCWQVAPYRVSFGSNICIHSGASTTYHIVEQSYHVFGNEPKQDLQNLLTCRMSYPTRTTSLASILSLLFGSGMPTQPDFGVGATKMNTYQKDSKG